MKAKKKQIIVTALLIAICLVTLVGSSYALFTKTLSSTKKISVQAGTLKVDFAEGNRINLSNVAPMSDNDGMNTTPYTFTITNSGSVAAYYTIRNEEDSSNTLNNKYIKYRLISDNYDSGIKTLDTMGSGYYMLSSENTLAVGKSITYKLYLWLSSEADNDAQNKTYQSKIVVQSTTNSISDIVATTLLKGVGDNGSIDASDPEQTFITGTNPNNYIWYSGKLWRAVSIDPSDNSVKLVTQWSVASLSYNPVNSPNFKDSYIEQWLNDTTIDGFLANLREPERFIKTDSVWNATATSQTSKPVKTAMVTAPVGLLSLYEYSMSHNNVEQASGYLMNGSNWWTLTPASSSTTIYVDSYYNTFYGGGCFASLGIRPAINLKGNIKIIGGSGTSDEPYRLEYDEVPTSGTLLSTRYSGEYISFGTGENNLYRIVSHENETGTKIVSATPLKENTNYKTDTFNNINSFLNNNFLINNTYITTDQLKMLEDNNTWYIGYVGSSVNYKYAKYSDISNYVLLNSASFAKIGILRYGELMTGQEQLSNNGPYWLSTNHSSISKKGVGTASNDTVTEIDSTLGVKPAMNLKSNVVITGGDGTKNNPFTVALQ